MTTRSRRETICLRVVLGVYAAILIVAGILWRETCIFLYIVTMVWAETVQHLMTAHTLPSWNVDDYAVNALFGLIFTSGFLALELVLHAINWGVRLSGRWVWRFTAVHAVVVLGWLPLYAMMTLRASDSDYWFPWTFLILAIAVTKLTCAILVLREKRELPDADDVLPGNP